MESIDDLKFIKYYSMEKKNTYSINYTSSNLIDFLTEIKTKDVKQYEDIVLEINNEEGINFKEDTIEFEYYDFNDNFREYDMAYKSAIIERCREIATSFINDAIKSKLGRFGYMRYFRF